MDVWMFSRCACLLALLTATACSNGDDDGLPDGSMEMDAGTEDAGFTDTGMRPDSGVVDTGSDAGFADPNTIVLGYEEIDLTRTFVHVRGTETSTLPPIVVLPTGLHQGGVSGFFGQLGGGIGHEHLPEHLDFLLPGRLMIYFDFKATGRSAFGGIGTATVSAENHVLQVGEVIDWVGTKLSIDTSQVDIIGHGYGGGIGAVFAAENPDRVSRLVLVDPMAATVQRYAEAIAELQSRLSSSDRLRLDSLTREPECRGSGSDCTVEIWRILAPRLGCPGNEARVNTLMFLHGEIRAFDYIRRDLTNDQFDWVPLLPLIEADTTVISGPCDATAPEVALTYTASISGAVHEIIPNTGHWPMVEDTITFQRVMRQALRHP